MKSPRRLILSALVLNGLAWLIAITADYWARPLAEAGGLAFGVIFVLAFGFALIAAVVCLTCGLVWSFMVLHDNRDHRTWPNLILIGFSTLNLVTHAVYLKIFFYG